MIVVGLPAVYYMLGGTAVYLGLCFQRGVLLFGCPTPSEPASTCPLSLFMLSVACMADLCVLFLFVGVPASQSKNQLPTHDVNHLFPV